MLGQNSYWANREIDKKNWDRCTCHLQTPFASLPLAASRLFFSLPYNHSHSFFSLCYMAILSNYDDVQEVFITTWLCHSYEKMQVDHREEMNLLLPTTPSWCPTVVPPTSEDQFNLFSLYSLQIYCSYSGQEL